jgi:hypothetical protein
LPQPLQQLIENLLRIARNTEAEKEGVQSRVVSRISLSSFEWVSLLALTNAAGLFVIAYTFTRARAGGTGINTLFLSAMLLMFTPIAIRLLLPSTTRSERIGLLSVLGISCYLVKVIANPLYFTFFDEFLHWRTLQDITHSEHLFTPNSLLPVSPYYPGLEIITNAFSTISGLSSFHASLVVIGVARLLMVLALFALNEQILKSTRAASLATLLYMINPHFLFFDAQYGYESLALPLAVFMLFSLSPHQKVSIRPTQFKRFSEKLHFPHELRSGLNNNLRWISIVTWFVLVAVVLTHHVTDFFFESVLAVWAFTYTCKRLIPFYRSILLLTAGIGITASALSILRVDNPVISYLSSFMGQAFEEFGHIISGTGAAKQLFANYSGPPTPLWERLLTIVTMALIVFSLPFGLLCLWQRLRSNALALTLGLFSLLYPISQAFRLTNSGSEVADRAAAFLFIPIALVLALFVVQFWPTQRLRWFTLCMLAGAMSLVFIGGIVLGDGPASALLPGPYEATADNRSIEPQGIQAALWSQDYLKSNNRFAADRINQVILGTYGNQRIVTSIQDTVDLSAVFLDSTLSEDDIAQIQQAQIRYLVTDMRLTHALPLLGYYYEMDEPDAYHHKTPIPAQAFLKFNHAPQIDCVFDSGDILIYDVGGLSNAPKK